MAQLEAHRMLGTSIDVDPGEAILALVGEAAGNVAYYRSRLPEVEDAVFSKTFHQTGKETGEAKKNVLVALYDEAMDRLARYAKQAHDMGVNERQIRLAERQGQLVIDVIVALLGDPELGLTSEQQQAGRVAAARHLRAVAVEASVVDPG